MSRRRRPREAGDLRASPPLDEPPIDEDGAARHPYQTQAHDTLSLLSGSNRILLNMKKDNIIYWTTTGIICAVMLYSAINFALDRPLGPAAYKAEGAFAHLKLPPYFKIELTTAKLLGVLALLLPGIPSKIREFAYFGFALTLVSASFAHFSVGDGPLFVIDPLIFLGVLSVSYWYFCHREQRSHPDAPTA